MGNKVITDEIERRLINMLDETPPTGNTDYPLFVSDEILKRALQSVNVMDQTIYQGSQHILYHYQFQKTDQQQDKILEGENFFRRINLPNRDLDSLWMSLHFDSNIKNKLLQYASTILETSCSGLDHTVFDLHKY